MREAAIERLRARAVTVPTERAPQADGTLVWRATTMVLVECSADGVTGIGYSYVHACAKSLIEDLLRPEVLGRSAFATGELSARMARVARNQGREGISAMAIAAVDISLWDLKARLLEVPLAVLLGDRRDEIPVYASGGFTTTAPRALYDELSEYHEHGMRSVKIKIGRDVCQDTERLRAARAALGPDMELMVDANGAYERKRALTMAERLTAFDVSWFEEPVSSDDLAGLRMLRDRAPARLRIAAGEYGYHATYFRRMLAAQAVDVLQVDATRCQGVTGFLRADALCAAFDIPLSTHCAPALHAHLAAAATRPLHVEYFRDHARMEALLFAGTPPLRRGMLRFDRTRPGLGLTLREREIARHAA